MRTLIIVVIGLLSGATWASCKPDVGGTFRTNQMQAELEPVKTILCFWCREINHHPKDIRNFMWNWAALGRATVGLPAMQNIGREIFDNRLDAEITAVNVYAGVRSDTMSVPVCNDHGQCATGTIQVEHNYERVNFAQGWYLYFNTSIKRIQITVTLANGDTIVGNYTAEKLSADRARSGYKLPVPYNNTADFAEDGDCLNNHGQKRPPDPQMGPANYPSSGSYGDSGDDPWEHWYDEEEAYTPRGVYYRCGTIGSSQGSWTTCGWFYS